MTMTQPVDGIATPSFGSSPYWRSSSSTSPLNWRNPVPPELPALSGTNLFPFTKLRYSDSPKRPPIQAETPQPPFSERSTWFTEASRELEEIDSETAEGGLSHINANAKSEARRILSKLSRTVLIAPTVYPTLDGEIAIQFDAPLVARAVVIELNNDGQAACFASIDGRNRRARYSDSSDLPDEFLDAQLRTLAASAQSYPYGTATP